MIKIVNVVITADLKQQINLYELVELPHVFYDSDVYGGKVAYYKSPKMQGKVAIFFTGKMIGVGTTSERNAKLELEQTIKFLVHRKIVAEPETLKPVVQNIVVTVDFGESIDIEEVSSRNKVIYEPEQFPAGILKVDRPFKATILLYSTGKAVFTGLKSSKHIEPLFEHLKDTILRKNRLHI